MSNDDLKEFDLFSRINLFNIKTFDKAKNLEDIFCNKSIKNLYFD